MISKSSTFSLPDHGDRRFHSRSLDGMIAPNIYRIEQSLVRKYPHFAETDYTKAEDFKGSQPWIGVHPDHLQTPYSDFFELFQSIGSEYEIKKIVDIGSAYGRAALVKNVFFPKAQFIGYEIVTERVKESKRLFRSLKVRRSKVLNQNILEHSVESADLYIVYDFSCRDDIKLLAHKLSEVSSERPVILATRGKDSARVFTKDKRFEKVSAVSSWKVFQRAS